MPKKGNTKEPNKEQKNPQGIPVVNGVQSSLVWVRPHTNRDLNFYMPPGEFTADTEKGFRKVMKEGGVTSTEDVNASSVSMYLAARLSRAALSGAVSVTL